MLHALGQHCAIGHVAGTGFGTGFGTGTTGFGGLIVIPGSDIQNPYRIYKMVLSVYVICTRINYRFYKAGYRSGENK